jgi:Skp family chaperone for outer membrane proteins
MKTKRWLSFLVASAAIVAMMMMFGSISGAASQPKLNNVGSVDVNKLHDELPVFQNLQEIMKEKENGFKSFQGYILSQHRVALKELQDKAAGEKKGKSTEEQTSIDRRYQEDVKKQTDELNNKLERERDKIVRELNDLKRKADEGMRKIINDVAGDKKLAIVFDKNAVLFGGTDITDAVIAKAKKDIKDDSKKNNKTDKTKTK